MQVSFPRIKRETSPTVEQNKQNNTTSGLEKKRIKRREEERRATTEQEWICTQTQRTYLFSLSIHDDEFFLTRGLEAKISLL